VSDKKETEEITCTGLMDCECKSCRKEWEELDSSKLLILDEDTASAVDEFDEELEHSLDQTFEMDGW